jgi:phosphopantothenoylcysteine decarboxylase/phosphopantothenate--cysteine ligase
VRENLQLLRGDGCRVLGADGEGMVPAGEVAARILSGLGGPLSGLKVLVTAGGTREPMDSVRFVGNRSSGKMGLAVAREAQLLGAEVSVVAANVEAAEPGTGWVLVETVDELQEAVLRMADGADVLVMAAAVSDFTPAEPVDAKIRRGENLTVEFTATADILEAVRKTYPDLFVVGFAATHGDPVADAVEKLGSKGVNLVVGNDISRPGIGFGSDENEVYVVGEAGERFVARASKREVARVILDTLAVEIKRRGGNGA